MQQDDAHGPARRRLPSAYDASLAAAVTSCLQTDQVLARTGATGSVGP